MALPIRKLPMLVIHLILQTMGFLDLFLLTRTSTKMRRIAKNMSRTQNHNLFVTVEKPLMIQIQSRTNLNYTESLNVQLEENKPHRRFLFRMEIGSVDRLPSAFQHFEDGSVAVDTYWNDTKAGCITLCNELVEVFRAPVRGVILNLNEIGNYRNEIRWVNSTFPALLTFTIRGKCSFQEYMWMIRNSRATEALYFEMKPSKYPENMENLEVDLMDLETVVIDHGRWVSLQQLQAIEASFISIKDSDLTDSEINAFLINLETSQERPKFKKMNIFIDEESDLDVVLEGLDFEGEDGSEPEDIFSDIVFTTGSGQKCTISYNEFDDEGVVFFGFEIRIGN